MGGELDRATGLVAEVVRLRVDIIAVAGGMHGVRTAKHTTKTISIVIAGAGLDPVEAGFVESLARLAHLFQLS